MVRAQAHITRGLTNRATRGEGAKLVSTYLDTPLYTWVIFNAIIRFRLSNQSKLFKTVNQFDPLNEGCNTRRTRANLCQ